MLKEDVNFSYTSYKTFKTNNKISKLINVPEFFNYETFLKKHINCHKFDYDKKGFDRSH